MKLFRLKKKYFMKLVYLIYLKMQMKFSRSKVLLGKDEEEDRRIK